MTAAVQQRTFSLRLLTEADAESAFDVHCTATCSLNHDVVRLETLEFIREQINDGFMVGAFGRHQTLIAYGVLTTSTDPAGKVANILRLDPLRRARFCLLDGVAVHPEWQRCGIHDALIAERLCYARDLGRDIVGVTVSPRNPKSLKNLLQSGFRIVEAALLYGGYQRLILVRDSGFQMTELKSTRLVVADQFELSVDAIRSGLCGFELTSNAKGQAVIHYGAP